MVTVSPVPSVAAAVMKAGGIPGQRIGDSEHARGLIVCGRYRDRILELEEVAGVSVDQRHALQVGAEPADHLVARPAIDRIAGTYELDVVVIEGVVNDLV